jgi:iron complex outermembrane receptor protein|tara:strand:- start:699 stop:3059 length:2361 start_codon:yes stop_codon:yes gene_type:complete
VLTIIITGTAFAVPTFAEEDELVLEEVVVTATRRGATDILTTPVSITALDGEDVEKFAIRDLNDIAKSVPGLSAGTVSAFKSAQFAMRGVSETTIILYKESPVGVTLDDFVVPHIQTANLEVFDIESIEVLRGPQGTLFGKNTTGGVINVRTKRPVLGENSLDLRAHYGEYGTRKYNAALNFAVGETLAFRFAGMQLDSDGFYENNAPFGPLTFVDPAFAGQSGQGDGRDLGGDDVFSGRVKVLWEPNDRLSVVAQYEIVRDEGDTPPIVNESGAGYVFPVWGYPGAGSGDPLQQAGNTLRDDLGLRMTDGHRVDIDGFYLNAEWDVTDSYTLYLNAGDREQEARLPSSYTGTTGPQSLFDATRDDNRDTRQLEIRLGSNLEGPFNFTTGAFFQEDETEFCVLQVVGFLDNFFLGTPSQFFNDNPLILCNRQDAEAQAIYFDGSWDATDDLHITAGLRYTDEEKDWAGRPRVNLFLLDGAPTLADLGEPVNAANFDLYPTGVVRDSASWDELTYRLNFGYDFNEDVFGFFGYSRGFKSGGYNDQLGTQLNPITPLAAQPTDPEIADSYEAGVKFSFADGAANLSLNAYYVEYSDAQRTFNVSFPGGGQETLFFNAAEMTVTGLEAEGSWIIFEGLTLNYSASWMDAEFDSFEADTNFDGMIDIDLSGQPVTRAPELMANADLTYEHAIAGGHRLEWKLRVSYEDESVASYSDVSPQFNTMLNSKTLVDASISFYDAEDRYFIRAVGSNITDESYRTGSLSVATLWIMSAYGAPRYYGLEAGMKIGG